MRNLAAFGLLARQRGFAVRRAPLRAPTAKGVQVVADEAQRRVDITIDGEPFTSYIWPTRSRSRCSIRSSTPDGMTVTRGYPLDHGRASASTIRTTPACGSTTQGSTASTSGTTPKPSSRKTTPRWAPSSSTRSSPPERSQAGRVGHALHMDRRQRPPDPGRDHALRLFSNQGARVIDRTATLKALDQVVFKDEKDGMLGLRVASWLESPDGRRGHLYGLERRGHQGGIAPRPDAPLANISPAKA